MRLERVARRALVIPTVVATVIGVRLLVAQDRAAIRLQSALAADDPAFPDYASVLTGAHVTQGDHYEVLENGVRMSRRRISCSTTPRAGHSPRRGAGACVCVFCSKAT